MLKRRTLLALGGLAVAVAAAHAWLIGRGEPRGAALPAAAPAVVLAAASVPAAPVAPEPPPLAGAPLVQEEATTPGPAASARPAATEAVPAAAPRPRPPRVARAASAPAAATQEAGVSRAGEASAPAPSPEGGEADGEAPALALAAAPAATAMPVMLPAAPVYRTRIPPAVRLQYRLSRGPIVGSGEIDWRPEGAGYRLSLEGTLPLIGTLITQTSRGRFDAAGLAPERYTDRRLRRSERAANFDRAAGRVAFSGGSAEQPLRPGMQDRLSVMVQLAAIAAAGPQPPPPGQPVRILVVGARGDVAEWRLRFEGVQGLKLPGGAVQAWHYVREPESDHDTRAEYWLDPAQGHLPVRVRLTDGRGDPLELLRQAP